MSSFREFRKFIQGLIDRNSEKFDILANLIIFVCTLLSWIIAFRIYLSSLQRLQIPCRGQKKNVSAYFAEDWLMPCGGRKKRLRLFHNRLVNAVWRPKKQKQRLRLFHSRLNNAVWRPKETSPLISQ